MTRSSSRCHHAALRWSPAALAAIALIGAAAPPAAANHAPAVSFQVGFRIPPVPHHRQHAHRAPDYRQGYADGWRAGWREGYLAGRYGRPSRPQAHGIPALCSRRYASGYQDGHLIAYRAAWDQGRWDRYRDCTLPW